MRQSRHTSKSESVAWAARSVVEGLEARQLLSVTLENGLLQITGTDQADQIKVRPVANPAKLKVVVNHEVSYFNRADIQRIRIDALGGNDNVQIYEVGGKITIPAAIYGGDGNDNLVGGSGSDSIYGGAGNDTIVGGAAGDNTLAGGSGDDKINARGGGNTINGGPGNNTLVTATTDTVIKGGGNDRIEKGVVYNFPIFTYTGVPSGYAPAQIRQAYGLGDLNNSNFTNRGQGQAMAIIDIFHTPTLASDFRTFCQQYRLPMPTTKTFQVVNMAGSNAIVDEEGAGETVMDVEWAHVIAPNTKIYVIEAASETDGDILAAVQKAVQILNKNYGGGVVSMSLGLDGSGEQDYYQG
ncbi:MAG: hypothetical protein ABSH20_28695, partial [Tepidisphaeraceae bacterium]